MAIRTGVAESTLLIEHICRILTKYRPAMNSVIAAAVAAGTITTSEANTLGTFLDQAAAACAIIKAVSGY